MIQRVLRHPKPQPRFIEPMECQRVAKLPEGEDWIYEIKQDRKTKSCPFVNLPEAASQHQHAITREVMAECIWTEPKQPCEVEFVERTRHRRLRHAEFRRLT